MDNSLDQAMLSITDELDPDTTQYITFELAGYLFGLPSRDILRVVSTPPPSQGGLISMGMVQLGPYSIQILDLVSVLALKTTQPTTHPRPSAASSRALEKRNKVRELEPNENPPFLVVLQKEKKELWGIALSEPPDLMEVPNYALKPVPFHQRRSQSLKWVSHIVNYDLNRARHALLILDLSPILNLAGVPTMNEDTLKFTGGIKPPLELPK
ncbi:MAG: hypothetical protein ACFB16_10220 [Phormidesmis sp.]